MSSVAARFFPPQVAGAGATSGVAVGSYPFRIDHDEKFNQTTHVQYTVSTTAIGRMACGAALTGASTADWWQARRLATT